MTDPIPVTLELTPSGDGMPSSELVADEGHSLTAVVSDTNQFACLRFSSRLALYEFARSLLHEALFGAGGEMAFYPLEIDCRMEVIDGVRMARDSARVFVHYPPKQEAGSASSQPE